VIDVALPRRVHGSVVTAIELCPIGRQPTLSASPWNHFRLCILLRHLKLRFAAWAEKERNIMMEAVAIRPAIDTDEPAVAGVSWAAVTAGAIVSCALTLVVLAFGVGLGLSVVSPWGGAGVSTTTFKIGTGLFMIVVAMLSSSIGGYIAGRLRSRWIGVQTDEVYFRDTAHGFVAWALATVLGAVLLASPASSLIGGAASGLTQSATASAAPSSPMDGYVDMLLRANTPAPNAAGVPSELRAEVSRLLTSSLRNGGDLKPADRGYLAKVVAARTGLNQADAEKRVDEVVTEAKTDIDAARKAAAQLAFWLTASLLVGAFCASLAATEGGGLRDGTWGTRKLNR
jgi:hypothetical protein